VNTFGREQGQRLLNRYLAFVSTLRSLGHSGATMVRKLNVSLSIAVLVLLLATFAYLGYQHLLWKGVFCEVVGLGIFVHAFWRARRSNVSLTQLLSMKSSTNLDLAFLTVATIVFLMSFPFSNFLHAIGLAPGVIFVVLLSYLFSGLRDHSAQSMIAVVILGILVWLWGEAGRPGLVVMPVDLPEGRNDMTFTADGVANALETELEFFGRDQNVATLGKTEASKILAGEELSLRLFPENPWYKGSDSRPPELSGLQAGHVVIGTSIEGLPLSNIYHLLRHLRSQPLLEAQILLGEDHSLTLALRRLNGPLNCETQLASDKLLTLSPEHQGEPEVNDLWNSTDAERHGIPGSIDNLACSRSRFRVFLESIDLVPPPASEQERIANVTVNNLKGDAQLSAGLHLAALEAMQKLSVETMAQYYDNTGKYDSALSLYKKSLPGLLKESHDDPPFLARFPRQRLANTLIRIGDLEYQLRNNCSAGHHAYTLADAIEPDDFNVKARIGYGYLIRARELEWGTSSCSRLEQEQGSTAGKDQPRYTAKQISNSLEQVALRCQADSSLYDSMDTNLCISIYYLNDATQSDTNQSDALGLQRTNETLSWAHSNLAYALGVQNKAKNMEDIATQAARAVSVSDIDLRAEIAREYSDSLKELSCEDPQQAQQRVFDKKKERTAVEDTSLTFTLHNNILMEDQIRLTYENLSKSGKCASSDFIHKSFQHAFLLNSLQALDYLQTGSGDPSKRLEDFKKTIASHMDEKTPDGRLDYNTLLALRLAFITAEASGTKRTQMADDQARANSMLPNLSTVANVACSEQHFDLWYCSLVRSLRAKVLSLTCNVTQDQFGEAKQAATAFPDDAYLRTNLGFVQLKLGYVDEALTSFQEAVRIYPDDPYIRYLLSIALGSANRPEEARDQLSYGRSLDVEGWINVTQFLEHSLSTCPNIVRLPTPAKTAPGASSTN
jgi:tetratricopeptide (TPR) repeat protein